VGAPRGDHATGAAISLGRFALLDDAAPRCGSTSPTTLAALRMTLPAGDPVFDWSINELTVYGGE
jgi:hypothetical protein